MNIQETRKKMLRRHIYAEELHVTVKIEAAVKIKGLSYMVWT